MRKQIEINPNDKFNDWTVLKEVEKTTARRFLCKCKCGREKIIRIDSLLYGYSKHCRNCSKNRLTHGDSGTRLHKIWMGIANRCRFDKRYKSINRCKDWDDYNKFKEWSINNGYKDNLTIDRIDGTKGYYPENCRWVTSQIQAKNQKLLNTLNTSGYKGVCYRKRDNKWRANIRVCGKAIEIGGSYKTASEAAIAYDTYIIKNNLIYRSLNILKR